MLRYAGMGVAMGNATDDVKAVAGAICGDVAEDGIYHYCKEQGLIQEINLIRDYVKDYDKEENISNGIY